MFWAILVAFTYACLTFVMAVMFWRMNDGSLNDMIEWGALYFFGVIAPVLWSLRLSRLLRKQGLEVSAMNLSLAWSPVMVAVTILVFALPLMWGVWQQR
jgi:hypothetical protein